MQNKETKKTESARKQHGPLLLILVSLTIVVGLLSGFLVLRQHVNNVGFKDVTIGNKKFTLEIADTQSKREKGLSERDNLAPDHGMLFDFTENGDWRMWMVQMRFPIDIAWLTKDGKIVYIKHNAQPGDYPEIYHAGQQSWYAIEVPTGTFDDQAVKEGDTIRID
jgi:uncharacterized membrane protein (UPF0127 family)